VFHPKVWILRYTSEKDPIHYRVICQTRNLTFDSSWDTSLVLDGKLADRKVGYSANKALGDFIAALPSLAVDDVPAQIRKNVKLAASELRRVGFIPPEPFDSYSFQPLGIPGYTKYRVFEAGRTLVISPFLTPAMVRELGYADSGSILISRGDALDTLSKVDLSGFDEIYTLEPSADAELEVETPYAQDRLTPSTSLHAKLFVLEHGWESDVWTGSANATDAAFRRNVEFLVMLGGKKSVCGIDSILGAAKDQTALRNFLTPYSPREVPIECDAALEQLERELEAARLAIAGRRWRARVLPNQASFDLTLEAADPDPLTIDPRASTKVWPITLTDTSAKPLEGNLAGLVFSSISLEALTAFFAIDLSLRSRDQELRTRFVISAKLEGAPSDRREALLKYYLKDSGSLIRFLLLLLTPDDESTDASADEFLSFNSTQKLVASGPPPEALLEALLRAFHRNPATLESVSNAVEDLKKTEAGRNLIPEGFDRIWVAVCAAHNKSRMDSPLVTAK
jgi:hypothetical protein